MVKYANYAKMKGKQMTFGVRLVIFSELKKQSAMMMDASTLMRQNYQIGALNVEIFLVITVFIK